MLEVLHKLLREYYVLSIVRQAYNSVEVAQVKALFGFSPEDPAALEFLTKQGFILDGAFVHIPHNLKAGGAHQFTMDEARVSQLAKVVQFLEQ